MVGTPRGAGCTPTGQGASLSPVCPELLALPANPVLLQSQFLLPKCHPKNKPF